MQAVYRAFHNWLFQLRGPERGEIVLVQRRIFIVPTRAGLLFGVALLLMLTGSINYNLSLGFVLTFLLGSLGITAMLHTFRNLAGLRVSAARTSPVFAGASARFAVSIRNASPAMRYSIALTRDRREVDVIDIPPHQSAIATASVPALKRGLLRPGRFTLYTRFPVGLYYAWSYVEVDTHCIVYPKPAEPRLPLPPLDSSAGSGMTHGAGHEDFSGLRQYNPGDSPRHIAWKAAARDAVLLTKQFSGSGSTQLWLTLNLLPAHMGIEERLSHLTRWVLDADQKALSYGLKLPRVTVPIGTGEVHRNRCLEALALA